MNLHEETEISKCETFYIQYLINIQKSIPKIQYIYLAEKIKDKSTLIELEML